MLNSSRLSPTPFSLFIRGELTAEWREQNLDLISGENSVEALLEKIKIERHKLTSNKKTRKTKAT